MSLFRTPLALLCVVAAVLTGCEAPPPVGGPDMKFLTTPLEGEDTKGVSQSLLPLTKGNSWQMTSYVPQDNLKNSDKITMVGPITIDGFAGTEVTIQRDGKKWRREAYRLVNNELQLIAAQDENSDLMRYNPPIPLLKYPVHEGDSVGWSGSFRLGKTELPAQALSRISGTEKIKTPAGVFTTYRVDTVLVVTQGENEIRFPVVRWLSPGVGFVRRGYADKGRPAYSEVTRFDVR
jgi:hypothetical protein